MKHLLWALVVSVLFISCSEEEISSSLNLTAEGDTLTVILNNIPNSQLGNPVYVTVLNNSDEAFFAAQVPAVEDTTVLLAPPPGTASFTIVAYIPTEDEWELKDDFAAGYYSTITGATERGGRYVTNTWDQADDYEDSDQSGADLTLDLDLEINDNSSFSSDVSPGDILKLEGVVTENLSADISSVEFAIDGAVIATINESPYVVNYNTVDLEKGAYVISATVTNEEGDTASDQIEINVVVDSNTAPSVDLAISGVSNGDDVDRQSILTINSNASDSEGLASVEFIIAGSTVATITDSPTSASYEWDTFDNEVGSVSIEVRATDTDGAVRSDFINVNLVDPSDYFPRASISNPSNESTIAQGTTSLNLTVSTSDPDGDPIGQVVWSYSGDASGAIATVTDAPYSFDWDPSALAAGTYTITARVYNDDLTSSATISIDEVTLIIE